MLPDHHKSPSGKTSLIRRMSMSRRYQYVKRMLKFKHMDFEFALWQMFYLCFSPKKVYKNFYYHRETKHQWARDDPAFLVLLSFWLCISSLISAFALGLHFVGFVKFLLWIIFIDCIGSGLIIAGFLWLATNKYLRSPGIDYSEHHVEYGYAFDVHLNAFIPLLLIVHIVQLICVPLNPSSFAVTFIGNTLWLMALVYYIYITFLGYSALPFLQRTVLLLYPIGAIGLFYMVSLCLNLNMANMLIKFYKYRVLGKTEPIVT